jgi:hypothetical protein
VKFKHRQKGHSRKYNSRQVLKIWENHITEIHDLNNQPENLELEPTQEIGADEKGPTNI